MPLNMFEGDKFRAGVSWEDCIVELVDIEQDKDCSIQRLQRFISFKTFAMLRTY